MQGKYYPLSVPSLKGNELKYVSDCIETEWVSSVGSYVSKFEEDIKKFTGAKNAVAVANGTAALHLSLIAAGVEEDDEVFVPTITFIAPVNAIRYVGAYPIFIDCDDYLNISPEAVTEFINKNCVYEKNVLRNKSTGRKISALVPVHIFGNPVDIEKIMEISEKYGLKVIEDATESLGSYYKIGKYAGRKTGTIGHFGCFSFNGNKIITTGGGGMAVCNDGENSEKIRYLSTQAKDDALLYIHDNVGYNYRMTNLQAALGCAQLEKIEQYIEIKRENFEAYKKNLRNINGVNLIGEPEYAFSNLWFYSLLVDTSKIKFDKLKFIGRLKENKIESRPLWYLNHLQKPYLNSPKSEMKNSEFYYERIVNIPCSVNLTVGDVDYISKIIIEALNG